MYRTYTLRLRPNVAQRRAFEYILADSCETYNAALQERKEAWKLERKSIGLYDQFAQLTELRHEDPRFAVIAVDIQRDPLRRLDRAFRAFFRRCKGGDKPGFPRFRSCSRYDSFLFNLPIVADNHIRVPNVGLFRFKSSQNVIGVPRTALIKRVGTKWYIRLTCDIGTVPDKQTVSSAIGVDVGLNKFLTLSDSHSIPNPRWGNKHASRVAAANRSLARKVKRSKNRRRAKEILRRTHQRATDARRNFTHHVSKWLVSRYELIAFEKLHIRGMACGNLAKSIFDAAWGELLWQISYKAESAGRWAVPVNPRGTSIRCSGCGAAIKKTLADRRHICGCGLNLDRDHNAAINILRLGMSLAGVEPSVRAISARVPVESYRE